jgi:hypothetical protein
MTLGVHPPAQPAPGRPRFWGEVVDLASLGVLLLALFLLALAH